MSSGNLESYQPLIIGAIAVTLPITVISFILRLLCRKLTKHPHILADVFALVAFVFCIGLNVSKIVSVRTDGLGHHIYDLDISVDDAIYRTQKPYMLARFLYIASIYFSQMALLCLYLRIFGVERTFNVWIYVMMAYSTAWFLSIFFANLFQCSPVQKAWNSKIEGHCSTDRYGLFFAMILGHTLLDVAMVILPISKIRQLRLRRAHKFGLGLLFGCGVLVVASSIPAIIANITTKDPRDVTWNVGYTTFWTLIEVNLGLVTANMPMTRAGFRELLSYFPWIKADLTTTHHSALELSGNIMSPSRDLASKSKLEQSSQSIRRLVTSSFDETRDSRSVKTPEV